MIFDHVVDGQQICYPCTPGGSNTFALVEGDPKAAVKEAGYFLDRSICVGLGLLLTGVRGQRVLWGALAGGAAIELFALGYARYRVLQKQKEEAVP